jgi:hypothetical protein
MKKLIVVFASVVIGFCFGTAGAQPGQPPRPSFDGAMAKLFGDNQDFSGTMEFHYTQSSGNEIMMPGKVAHLADKSRFDMDMSMMQGGNIPPQAASQMKKMGLSKIATLSLPDKKTTYLLYPDLKAYVETPSQGTNTPAADYKMETTKLGEETIDGHDCVKNKVVVTGPDGVPHESTVWNASDLKKFPIKIQTSTGQGAVMVMLFKDVKMDKPDASQFELPSDYTKYDDMMSLMMSRARGSMQ